MSELYRVTAWVEPVLTAWVEVEADSAEQALEKGKAIDWDKEDFEECDRALPPVSFLRAFRENDDEDEAEEELCPYRLRLEGTIELLLAALKGCATWIEAELHGRLPVEPLALARAAIAKAEGEP